MSVPLTIPDVRRPSANRRGSSDTVASGSIEVGGHVYGTQPRQFELLSRAAGASMPGSPSSRDVSDRDEDGGPTDSRAASRQSARDQEEDEASLEIFDELEDGDVRPAVEAPAMVTPTALTSPGSPWPFTGMPRRAVRLGSSRGPSLDFQVAAPTSEADEDEGEEMDGEGRKKVSAATIPHEILLHILRLVGATSDLKRAVLVCKSWCQCGVELLWHKPVFHTKAAMDANLRVLGTAKQTFPYALFVKRLNFAGLNEDVDDLVLTRLVGCERLERLTLAGSIKVRDDGLCVLLRACRNLVALDLSECTEITDRTVVTAAESCPRLQGLNLSGCKKVTDAGISAIASSARSLRRIKLRNLVDLTNKPIIHLARQCPLLLEVDLHGCTRLNDSALWAIWRFLGHLRELSIGLCSESGPDGFPRKEGHKLQIGGGPAPPKRIEAMWVDGEEAETEDAAWPTWRETDHGRKPEWAPVSSRNFEHIRFLDLTALNKLDDETVGNIVTAMPRIRNLILAKCHDLTDESILSVCKLGKHLHFLHLGHVALITDAAVSRLARACTRLRYIDLACCPLLTDMSVTELAHNLHRLKRIGLVRVQNLTDESINALVDRSSIERIHLSYCDNVSVGAIHYLLSRLHKLTHLSLTGVPAFRRQDLQEFCRSPPRDFNSHQRAAFCVYSGKGVQELRRHLNVLAEFGDPAFPPLPLVPSNTFDRAAHADARRRGFAAPPPAQQQPGGQLFNLPPLPLQWPWNNANAQAGPATTTTQAPANPPAGGITSSALATLNAQRGPAAVIPSAPASSPEADGFPLAGPSRTGRTLTFMPRRGRMGDSDGDRAVEPPRGPDDPPEEDDDDGEGTVRGLPRFDAARDDLATFQARSYAPIDRYPIASSSRHQQQQPAMPMEVDDEAEGASDDMDEDR